MRSSTAVTSAENGRKLEQLAASVFRTAAKRELALRTIEGAEFMPRPVHPELVIFRQADVEGLGT